MICFDNQSQISVSKSNNGRGSNWTHGETAALLAIWVRANVQARFDGSVRDQKTYIHISKEMAESGHDRNPIKIKYKIKKMKKKTTEHVGITTIAAATTRKPLNTWTSWTRSWVTGLQFRLE